MLLLLSAAGRSPAGTKLGRLRCCCSNTPAGACPSGGPNYQRSEESSDMAL